MQKMNTKQLIDKVRDYLAEQDGDSDLILAIFTGESYWRICITEDDEIYHYVTPDQHSCGVDEFERRTRRLAAGGYGQEYNGDPLDIFAAEVIEDQDLLNKIKKEVKEYAESGEVVEEFNEYDDIIGRNVALCGDDWYEYNTRHIDLSYDGMAEHLDNIAETIEV